MAFYANVQSAYTRLVLRIFPCLCCSCSLNKFQNDSPGKCPFCSRLGPDLPIHRFSEHTHNSRKYSSNESSLEKISAMIFCILCFTSSTFLRPSFSLSTNWSKKILEEPFNTALAASSKPKALAFSAFDLLLPGLNGATYEKLQTKPKVVGGTDKQNWKTPGSWKH